MALFDVAIAQILLTRDTLAEELLAMSVVPIVNENDTVSNAEIRFGDNDTLSAITAGMVNADYLFLCTDVECLYTDNPRTNPEAKAVRVVEDIAKLREEVTVTSPGSSLGTGGMVTKLIAADLATAAGCTTIITLGSQPQRIVDILDEVAAHSRSPSASAFAPTIGTHFLAKPNPMVDRKWWILHGLATHGSLVLDAGAVRAVARRGNRSSLFAAGVVGVDGLFSANQCVRVMTRAVNLRGLEGYTGEGMAGDEERLIEVGKGIVNYSSAEIARIKGCRSREILERLGYMDSDHVVHRDNLAVTLVGFE
ncbi:hypothetical protein HK101_008073 [Irineochytrium annulatum]|nr:hypothetical protein HK101_008073 [Irineochytrium annulatum]